MPLKPLPPFTIEQVKKLKLSDLVDGEMTLYNYCIDAWSREPEDGYLKQQLSMLNKVPMRLGYYYLIHRFAGEWSNGGMQAVALNYDPEINSEVLRKTAEAHRFFGDLETSKVIDQLIPVSLTASRKLAELDARNASDTEFKAVWATIDAFDPLYEKSSDQADVYQAIVEDMHRQPEEYVP